MTQEEEVLVELLNCNAISENTGLTASEVSELVTHNNASSRLSSLRQKGYVKSSSNNRPISVYWLSKEGIELASEIKTKQDQPTDAIIDDATSQANSDIPPPQYNPDDVAFKNGDITESWYMVDGIDAQFETSSDAIAAAHDYAANHNTSTTVHVVASRKFAIIKPVITTELEYL